APGLPGKKHGQQAKYRRSRATPDAAIGLIRHLFLALAAPGHCSFFSNCSSRLIDEACSGASGLIFRRMNKRVSKKSRACLRPSKLNGRPRSKTEMGNVRSKNLILVATSLRSRSASASIRSILYLVRMKGRKSALRPGSLRKRARNSNQLDMCRNTRSSLRSRTLELESARSIVDCRCTPSSRHELKSTVLGE